MTPETIRLLRERRGWNQQQLAERLGIDQTTVSRLENGVEPSGPVRLLLQRLLEEPSENAA
jgi:transcriptional regulator with XRE-family HTH domain